MYIANKTNKYPCSGFFSGASTVRFAGIEGLTLPISGEIKLISEDDDFELATVYCGDYARQTYENGVLTLTNEPIPVIIPPTEEELKAAQIVDLKCQLESTDYKITKCYEYSLVSLSLPYDVVALHVERQALRDQINALGG